MAYKFPSFATAK